MQTIIKWPGGKSRELEKIQDFIPSYDRYLEPFFGGGAVFFSLQPKRAEINDISPLLMDFYKLIKSQDEDFRQCLISYSTTFSSLLESTEKNYDHILTCYQQDGNIDQLIKRILDDTVMDRMLIIDPASYSAFIKKMVTNKFSRTKANHIKNPFSDEDLKGNLQTGFLSGYYMYFRDVYNKLAAGTLPQSNVYKIANFYFIREYCYGSMFRYNAKGEFNIPYGGMSYNTKNFSSKIDHLFTPEISNLFENTNIHSMDFEAFLDKLHPTENDFIFLDPPYDTKFSSYENRIFSKDDQQRLAGVLKHTKANFLLLIENTDFIFDLYKKDFRVLSFDKSYTYNVRSRNNRDVEYLLITNIPE